MGDRLVLWSGGGRFVASKDVASAAIVQLSGGIRVDWGNGDVETITGTNPTITKPLVSRSLRYWSFTLRLEYTNGSVTVNNNYEIVSFFQPRLGGIDYCRTLVFGAWYNYYFVWYNAYSVESTNATTSQCGGRYTSTLLTCPTGATPWQWVKGLVGYYQGLKTATLTYNGTNRIGLTCNSVLMTIVTSNTGASSERYGDRNPTVTVLPSGIVISVTYTDGTKTEIPLTYTPTWVEVKPANSCPPNTCFECEHDGEKCCFAKDTDGLIKVIDRFHLTS